MTEPDLSLDVVMARRFEIVEQQGVISGRHKAELQPLNEELELCETFIRKHMLDENAQSFTSAVTGHHTHFETKDSVTVKDMDSVVKFMIAASPCPPEVDPAVWPTVQQHVAATGMWGLLNNAVKKTSVKELIEAKNPPPGVEYRAYRDLAWRRGKGE